MPPPRDPPAATEVVVVGISNKQRDKRPRGQRRHHYQLSFSSKGARVISHARLNERPQAKARHTLVLGSLELSSLLLADLESGPVVLGKKGTTSVSPAPARLGSRNLSLVGKDSGGEVASRTSSSSDSFFFGALHEVKHNERSVDGCWSGAGQKEFRLKGSGGLASAA